MKNKNNIILGVIGIIVIVAVAIVSPKLTSDNKKSIDPADNSDQAIFARATSEASKIKDEEKKSFKDIDVDTFVILLNNESKSLVLVGRKDCQYCSIAEPIIQSIMYKHDIDINYVSTDYFTKDSYEKFSNSNPLLKSFATPFFMVVSNGQIVDYLQGLRDTASYEKFLINNGFINE